MSSDKIIFYESALYEKPELGLFILLATVTSFYWWITNRIKSVHGVFFVQWLLLLSNITIVFMNRENFDVHSFPYIWNNYDGFYGRISMLLIFYLSLASLVATFSKFNNFRGRGVITFPFWLVVIFLVYQVSILAVIITVYLRKFGILTEIPDFTSLSVWVFYGSHLAFEAFIIIICHINIDRLNSALSTFEFTSGDKGPANTSQELLRQGSISANSVSTVQASLPHRIGTLRVFLKLLIIILAVIGAMIGYNYETSMNTTTFIRMIILKLFLEQMIFPMITDTMENLHRYYLDKVTLRGSVPLMATIKSSMRQESVVSKAESLEFGRYSRAAASPESQISNMSRISNVPASSVFGNQQQQTRQPAPLIQNNSASNLPIQMGSAPTSELGPTPIKRTLTPTGPQFRLPQPPASNLIPPSHSP